MGQIDWPGLIWSAVWIVGLSIALAAWSYASWWAGSNRAPVRRAAGRPSFIIPFFAGLALFSAGLAWSTDRLWLRALWIAAGLGCLWEVARVWRGARSRKPTLVEGPDETH